MYSREIVDKALALHRSGWSHQYVARACGVSERAVGHWANGRRRTRAKDAERTAYCPKCGEGTLDPLAYSYLLGLYLGDGYIGAVSKGVHYLSIICSDTWPGLKVECETALARVYPVSVFKVQREGCTEIKSTSKHWPCIFPQHGKGYKHSRRIALEPWQAAIVNQHPEALIRGLIHSDGCRVINRIRRKRRNGETVHYEYPRYHFTNSSTDIVRVFTDALDRLDIAWKIHVIRQEPRYRDKYVVSVSQRDAVARMDAFVGPKY
ncbi:helix-turn-helix transcriptional regulator [Nocardiopsis sp. NPDC007018]|uniref:helix-turn-helix domain-containing protein n=1 Tax=Nocardiopsis sp. NPDC007018 TaxID=3155721 RepID=UPI0033DC7A90